MMKCLNILIISWIALPLIAQTDLESATKSNSAMTASVPEEFQGFLSFDQRHIDLGKVKKGETRSGSFSFTNVSDEDVQIEFISVCECTEAKYPQSVIAPGESGQIDFTFDSSEKEESETITLDILLTNREPTTGYQVVESANYSFELIK